MKDRQGKKESGQDMRETVENRRTHVLERIKRNIPYFAPLCDGMNIEKMRVDIGDAELYCEREGKGTPIVLINGGPGLSHHYLHPYFSRAAEFAEVIYYDQRGCGQSDFNEGSGYCVEQAVDDLEKVRVSLGCEKWVVLGHSYGGVVARLYAEKYPDHVSGMVLVDAASDGLPITLEGDREFDAMLPEERKKTKEIINRKDLSPSEKAYNRHMIGGDWKRQGFYRPTFEEVARTVLHEWKNAGRGFLVTMFSSRGDLSAHPKPIQILNERPDIPVLIMEGKHDLTWVEGKAEKLKDCFTYARLVMFDKSAHNPFGDEPDKFFKELKGFILQINAPKPEEQQGLRRQRVCKNRSSEYSPT